METIKRNKKTGEEYPVSIKCGWPKITLEKRKIKKYPSFSRLNGQREMEFNPESLGREVVVMRLRASINSRIAKARADIHAKRRGRANLHS